jgi:epoxyqueuosine reductase
MNLTEEAIRNKTEWIKYKSESLGFSGVGIAKAEFLEEEADKLKQWLGLGYHGKMSYMENHFEKRTDPRLLVEGTKSVISLMYNYYTPENQNQDDYKISKYAYGRDYHKVIKKKLKTFFRAIEDEFGAFQGRYFVDSAPIMERDWAKRAGLGWIGKHTLLINPKKGSYFFLAEMLVDFELTYDAPIKDFCGSCKKCIEACPTDAIASEGYVLDASKCISYLTIELKDDIPDEFKGRTESWIFGCDICQDVCPWNRFSSEHDEPEFAAKAEIINNNPQEWESLDEDEFSSIFEGSAVKRTGYNGLKRNIEFVKKV